MAVKKIELFGPELSSKMTVTAEEEEIAAEMTEKFGEFRREVLLMK